MTQNERARLVPATLKTRKPVVKLSAADVRAFPVWEYAIDEEGEREQDETWVRPVDCAAIPKRAYSQIVARVPTQNQATAYKSSFARAT